MRGASRNRSRVRRAPEPSRPGASATVRWCAGAGARALGWLACLALCFLASSGPALSLATNKPPDKIPPLRPPLDLMRPGFWELHGTPVLIGVAAGLAALGFLIWWSRRPRRMAQEPAEAATRRALEALRGRAEEPALIAGVSRGLCRHVQAVHALPGEEWTTDELGGRPTRGPRRDRAGRGPGAAAARVRGAGLCSHAAARPAEPSGPRACDCD
jgi:hypothetical protein